MPLEKRCDKVFDCEDESDENFCQLVTINQQSYKRKYPPIKQGEKTQIETSIDILSVKDVDELEMKFTAELRVKIKWKDARLSYQNLKSDGNFLEFDYFDEIWKPPIKFSNTESNTLLLNKDLMSIQILKEGKAKILDDSELYEGMQFKGSENSLYLIGQYQERFHCMFCLANYPFDTQNCSIKLENSLDMDDFITLIPKELKFLGKNHIL